MKFPDRFRSFKIRLLHWEYWPWRIVYIPLFLQYFWNGLRSGFGFPTVINRPYMQYGGILEESKWEMYRKTPAAYMPPTLLHPAGDNLKELALHIRESSLSYPLIVKPDRGMRGKGIQIIGSEKELLQWQPHPDFDFIIQPFIDYPREIGVFMIRDPRKGTWRISSLMERQFLSVTGNGRSTLEELIRKKDRAFLQLQRWQQSNRFNLQQVIPNGREFKLESIGNHRLGTYFKDATQHHTPGLLKAMTSIAENLSGFEYGRMDIRFKDWDSLTRLESFILIEVNGANSEPAHIYDPKHNLFYAWKILLRHFGIQHQLAQKRLKKGEKAISITEARKLLKQYNHTMSDLD